MALEKFTLQVNVAIDIEELIFIARAAGEKILSIYEGERSGPNFDSTIHMTPRSAGIR